MYVHVILMSVVSVIQTTLCLLFRLFVSYRDLIVEL